MFHLQLHISTLIVLNFHYSLEHLTIKYSFKFGYVQFLLQLMEDLYV